MLNDKEIKTKILESFLPNKKLAIYQVMEAFSREDKGKAAKLLQQARKESLIIRSREGYEIGILGRKYLN